jgi:phosphatidylglycerophosphatase A
MTRFLTTFFGAGHLRPAPGTWASAVALALGLIVLRYLGFPVLVCLTLGVTLVGFWSCQVELAGRSGDDPAEVVIDEVAGQWLALLLPAAAFWWHGSEGWMPWPAWATAFVLFRLFDIWKPGVIGRADRRHDAAGVMLDDLWAGLFAGIGVLAIGAAAHAVMG